nr:Endonuclease exonuclease phosphatase domain containing protein [Haemonchus contortus]
MTFYTSSGASRRGGYMPGRDPVVDEVMRGWQERYCQFSDVSICITTFNVNGKSPPDIIPGWFSDDNVCDFYAIGLQEMDLSVGTYLIDNPKKMEEWMECIRSSLPKSGKNFRVVTSMRLIGIFIVLFQSKTSAVKVSKINSAYIATGISMFINKLGNKGGTAISLKLNDTLVCFVNCHLAAGTGELERRNQDFRDISQITFADGLSIYDHDAVFWFGDLNYRLKSENSVWSGDQVRHIASSSEFPALFKYDQLREQQSIGQVFVGFQEPEILPFRPTYKNALENDFPKDLTQLQVPPVALYSALMRLCDTLKVCIDKEVVKLLLLFLFNISEPLIPFSHHREIRVASNDPTALWKIVSSLPPVNATVLEYLLDYLRELIAQVPSAATDQLVAWADVLFHGGALLTTVPHLEPRVVALRSLCAYRKDVAIFGIS